MNQKLMSTKLASESEDEELASEGEDKSVDEDEELANKKLAKRDEAR